MKYHFVEATWPAGSKMVHVKKAVYESNTIEAATALARKEFGGATLSISPVPPHRFAVGDRVTFVNDYGVSWPGKTITELAEPGLDGLPRYHYTPTQTPWFSVSEKNLYTEAHE